MTDKTFFDRWVLPILYTLVILAALGSIALVWLLRDLSMA